ncbi:MAG: hypothetical protein ACSLFL_00245 [Alphaproteobacteria bacterium]
MQQQRPKRASWATLTNGRDPGSLQSTPEPGLPGTGTYTFALAKGVFCDHGAH